MLSFPQFTDKGTDAHWIAKLHLSNQTQHQTAPVFAKRAALTARSKTKTTAAAQFLRQNVTLKQIVTVLLLIGTCTILFSMCRLTNVCALLLKVKTLVMNSTTENSQVIDKDKTVMQKKKKKPSLVPRQLQLLLRPLCSLQHFSFDQFLSNSTL